MKCASGLDRVGRLYITAESRSDLGCQIAHAGIHPVTGAALVGKPSVDSQNHLILLWDVIECLILITQPEQLRLAVAPADIGAKLDEALVHHILERIRLSAVTGALDCDGSLVVGCGRGAPRAVLLLHIHPNSAVHANAVVAACLPGCRQKNIAQSFHRALTHHAVRRDAVNVVGALPGMVRAEFGVGHQRAVRVSHIICPPFPHGHEAAPARISVFREWAVPDAPHFQSARCPRWRYRRKSRRFAERCRCR